MIGTVFAANGLYADAKEWQSNAGIKSTTGFGIFDIFRTDKKDPPLPEQSPRECLETDDDFQEGGSRTFAGKTITILNINPVNNQILVDVDGVSSTIQYGTNPQVVNGMYIFFEAMGTSTVDIIMGTCPLSSYQVSCIEYDDDYQEGKTYPNVVPGRTLTIVEIVADPMLGDYALLDVNGYTTRATTGPKAINGLYMHVEAIVPSSNMIDITVSNCPLAPTSSYVTTPRPSTDQNMAAKIQQLEAKILHLERRLAELERLVR